MPPGRDLAAHFLAYSLEMPPESSSIPGHYLVAIDGVSGSGKSSTAKTVARELGILHLDTGAMYRAVTYLAQEKGLAASQTPEVIALARGLTFDVDAQGALRVDGGSLGDKIRTAQVSGAVSDFAKIGGVREALVEAQRRIGRRQSAVVEGRDMATVVFPEARFKFFMSASPEVRAMRRVRELAGLGLHADYEEVLKNLSERDAKDSSRDHSPLAKASGAVEIDTSGLTFADQVAIIVRHVSQNLS
jgi:cytidylate kinase